MFSKKLAKISVLLNYEQNHGIHIRIYNRIHIPAVALTDLKDYPNTSQIFVISAIKQMSVQIILSIFDICEQRYLTY